MADIKRPKDIQFCNVLSVEIHRSTHKGFGPHLATLRRNNFFLKSPKQWCGGLLGILLTLHFFCGSVVAQEKIIFMPVIAIEHETAIGTMATTETTSDTVTVTGKETIKGSGDRNEDGNAASAIGISGQSDNVENRCELTGSIDLLANFFTTNIGQQRPVMMCNHILMEVAQARAEDMAAHNYLSHVNLMGQGPNYLVTEAGYDLSPIYSLALNANQIESLYAGAATPAAVWAGWLASELHKNHVLGLHDFFKAQSDYGIGYAYNPNSEYKHYWVILITQPASTTSRIR